MLKYNSSQHQNPDTVGKGIDRATNIKYKYFIELPQKTIRSAYGDINYLELIKLNSTSTGSDGLTTKLLKNCIEPLGNIPTCYTNSIYDTGYFPNKFKIAKNIPIYKKSGSFFYIKNYRPISLMNIASKMIAPTLYNRLYSFFGNSKFLW